MRVLHIHGDGTMPDRAGLSALFGAEATHALVIAGSATGASGVPGAEQIDFPPLAGPPLPARLKRLASAMRGFDLVLTYGAGSLDAAMAHTLFAQAVGLPPLVHHEDAEPVRSRRRNWYRRIAFGRAAAVIVPTERLRRIALDDWQQPATRVRLVPPGADLAAFARKPRADALPRLIKRKGERWLGAFTGHDPAALLDALGTLPEAWQLVSIGQGPAREAIRAAATARELGHRVHTPGAVSHADAFGLLDLIAFATDPSPTVIAAAMAAGLAVAGAEAGAMAELLSCENAAELGQSIGHFATDPVRRKIGEANRAKAGAQFDARKALAARKAIYDAVARPIAPV